MEKIADGKRAEEAESPDSADELRADGASLIAADVSGLKL